MFWSCLIKSKMNCLLCLFAWLWAMIPIYIQGTIKTKSTRDPQKILLRKAKGRMKVSVIGFVSLLCRHPGHLRVNCQSERSSPAKLYLWFWSFNQCLIESCLFEDSADVAVGAGSVPWNGVCWKTLHVARAAGSGLMEHLWVSKIHQKYASHVSNSDRCKWNHYFLIKNKCNSYN